MSGGDWGWRNGSGKWPPYWVDTVPPVIDVGPGSPTGVTFGYGAKFPAKYQKALFMCDWSYGKLYALHLSPRGASLSGTLEEFVTGTPLALTDVIINQHDHAMYFLIGLTVFGVFGSFTYYLPELFPTRLRGSGAGFCYNVGRYIAAAGPFLVGTVAARGTNSLQTAMGALFWVGVVPLVGVVLALSPIVIETKGRQLS